MQENIIDGKKIAQTLKDQLKTDIDSLNSQSITPGLAVILVGNDPASSRYVNAKQKAAQALGIQSFFEHLPADISEHALLDKIKTLNDNNQVHGILVQLPLPEHINKQNIIEAIDPKKDVDGFHPYNLGRLAQRTPLLRPCTPLGIIHILKTLDIDLIGMNATVVGTSSIVGRPMMLELLMQDCTITVCHVRTNDLEKHVRNAELLISAVGKPGLIKGDWIKPGAIVIDVGITRLDNGKLAGDVEFDRAREKARWITPVPGGVGPMTVAMLMQNTVQAASISATPNSNPTL